MKRNTVKQGHKYVSIRNILKRGYKHVILTRNTVKQAYGYVIIIRNIYKQGYWHVIVIRHTVKQGHRYVIIRNILKQDHRYFIMTRNICFAISCTNTRKSLFLFVDQNNSQPLFKITDINVSRNVIIIFATDRLCSLL